MSAEYEDVLTNQPVVIDNVCADSYTTTQLLYLTSSLCRALERSRLDLLVRTIQSVFSPHSASFLFLSVIRNARPDKYFAASVGRPKHVRVMAGALEGDVFIGRKAQEFRGLLKIKYPMEHGIVTDWDDMERIWNWVYGEELGTLSEEVRLVSPRPKVRADPLDNASRFSDYVQHPVLLTEAPLNPRTNRESAAQILFDTFNVPALYISVQAVLSLYGATFS